MKLRIAYHDQNEGVADLLPREGVVVATPRCADSEHVWHLVRLEGPPLCHEGSEYSHLLVASR